MIDVLVGIFAFVAGFAAGGSFVARLFVTVDLGGDA
jgi:hypothetical protein